MSEQITMVDPRILKDHPRNNEFFDNVEGPEFDRLVDSIGDHGVLTPLRVTKDMTIISGHQRKRAAIKAERFEVPVIVDESNDCDDVLMKLIETNFGRIKNDPIKQAKWIKEYEMLRGVRQGSGGDQKSKPSETALKISQDDIAKELGVSRQTLQELKRLLLLDEGLQEYISNGLISAKTGSRILAKLSPDEQRELLDMLPEDVKLTASSIKEYIASMREAKDKRIHELENTLSSKQDELLAAQNNSNLEESDRNKRLMQEKRTYYEKWSQSRSRVEELETELEAVRESLVLAEAKSSTDSGIKALEAQVEKLKRDLDAERTENEALRTRYDQVSEQLEDLERSEKDGFLRYACPGMDAAVRDSVEQIRSLYVQVQTVVGNFNTSVRGFHLESDKFNMIPGEIMEMLVDSVSAAISEAKQLYMELIGNYNEDGAMADDSNGAA